MSLSSEELLAQGFAVERGIIVACNGIGLRKLLQAGELWLKVHVDFVNRLNVFPVPDGDTGTNMLLTMRAALAQVERAPDHTVGTIAEAAAQGALMGARGNSGVILSQFLQGVAQSLAGKVSFTAEDWGRASQVGVEQAYQSVVSPVEGTILTVARAVSEAAQQNVNKNVDLKALLQDMVAAARIAQADTPELLPILKEAGVTDAGGQGLVYLLEGALRFLNDEPIDLDSSKEEMPSLTPTLAADDEAYGYDVQFLIRGHALRVEDIRANIDSLGWSTVVVGNEELVKVHLHTFEPGAPISYGAGLGVISDVVVENMTEQARKFAYNHPGAAMPETSAGSRSSVATTVSNPPAANVGLLAVVPGAGLAHIFRSLGVSQIVYGGQTMNPSTQELLAAVSQVEAENVLILPNNGDVILSARQAESLSARGIKVVPTRTVPQGIAALLAFNYQFDLETNIQRMTEATRQVQTIEITRAVRASSVNGLKINVGDAIGLLDNELITVKPNYDEAVLDILVKINIEAYEIFSIYFGLESSQDQAEALADKVGRLYPDLEIELYSGGQPHYQYIISLE